MKGIFHSDTPHHLKNKRVNQGSIDKATANIILANTPKQLETTTLEQSITSSNNDEHSSHLNDCGKLHS